MTFARHYYIISVYFNIARCSKKFVAGAQNGVGMLNKSVAVVDVRSYEITAAVAERGVNGTFIIKSKFSSAYDGYAEGQMIDVRSFTSALSQAVRSILNSCGDKIKKLYIGVPGEFTKVVNTDKGIAFPSAKKVSKSEVAALEEASRPDDGGAWRLMSCGCQYYILSDMRRVVDPVGMLTDSLRGKMCFYMCSNSFAECVENALEDFSGIRSIKFLPSVHAEAMYLIPPERRDEYAVLLDFGYISSTYSVICGNGVAYSQSFSLGAGHLTVYLTEALGVPYKVAEALLGMANLNIREGSSRTLEYVDEGKVYSFPVTDVNAKVREGLDGICGVIEECMRGFTEKDLENKPLYLTGECADTVRGAADHISGRLVKAVNVTAPRIPYYDKPTFSSLFSLLDMALTDRESSSFFKFL